MDDQLALIFKQITDGKGSFRAAGSSQADIESFQRTVRELRELEANGYIDILDEHPEDHTGAHLIDLVLVAKKVADLQLGAGRLLRCPNLPEREKLSCRRASL